MDRGAWRATVHRVTQSWTRLSEDTHPETAETETARSRHSRQALGLQWLRTSRHRGLEAPPGLDTEWRPHVQLPASPPPGIPPDTSWEPEGERGLTLQHEARAQTPAQVQAGGGGSRDITLPTKVRLVNAMVFPLVIYGCESWTIRKPSAKELMLLSCGVGEDS